MTPVPAHTTAPAPSIVKVAIATPVRRLFDYRAPSGVVPEAGVRVRVPFRRSERIGVVIATSATSDLPLARLKPVLEILDPEPLLRAPDLALMTFAANYFHHSLGDALFGALPKLLRTGRSLEEAVRSARTAVADAGAPRFRLTEAGRAVEPTAFARSPRQRELHALLLEHPLAAEGLDIAVLNAASPGWRAPMSRLVARALVDRVEVGFDPGRRGAGGARPGLSEAQSTAVDCAWSTHGRFAAHLLDGVTGSGKTEVYLGLIERVVAGGAQVLVLIPEIALTPQLKLRFEQHLGFGVGVLHSGLNDSERLLSWNGSRTGEVAVLLGTRSAVFAPMPNLGLVVVDEEHDPSLKQHDGFRYNARDLAIKRAADAGVPIVLGSATPSLESLRNVELGRYGALVLPERAGGALAPVSEVVDLRGLPFDDGLSPPLIGAVRQVVERGEQALLFINRRGYAPIVLCHACGHMLDCHRCDARLVFHRAARPAAADDADQPAGNELIGHLRCHHCGSQARPPPACPQCQATDLRALGLGTERVATAIAARVPSARVARLDRDSTRRRGSLDALLEQFRSRQIDVLVGTQMLAKGHDFPAVTLVGILDADAGLFSADFRGAERMAQQILQVSGRAGRGTLPGRVLVQTHHPSNPQLVKLLRGGYAEFAEAALCERREAGLPPYSAAALLRAESARPEPGHRFLTAARDLLAPAGAAVRALGPVPAPMERRAGRYRSQLYLESPDRPALQHCLTAGLERVSDLPEARAVRWSIDVDPQDTL